MQIKRAVPRGNIAWSRTHRDHDRNSFVVLQAVTRDRCESLERLVRFSAEIGNGLPPVVVAAAAAAEEKEAAAVSLSERSIKDDSSSAVPAVHLFTLLPANFLSRPTSPSRPPP